MEQKKKNATATMKDVADQAGVSTATVSRALTNPDKVSAQTRQKVEQAALSVGYSPHVLSRHLKRNESHTILVIVPDICDPFFSEMIRGIEEIAAERGYLVLIGDCAHQHQQEKTFVNLLLAKQIDGMLLLGSDLPFDASKEEQHNLPPMVMANEFAPELELPTVHIDNLTAAFDAVHYLQKLGHQRIACIAGPDSMPLSQYRLQGYIQALRRSALTIDNQYIYHGEFSYETGARGLAALMSHPRPPTAIFCHNDIIALGAMSQAKKMGLDIPRDLSLIGFDDIIQAQYCYPPLTTVVHPRYQIGREAMLLLLDQLQGDSVSGTGSRLLASELKVRGSTAIPKRSV
ncbi:DNA-binding transcriptional regulator CytR [Affinibrenneria salicis]|uniref:DNA-binding transcriptional regulator CytR n=1 Tax=Affinibrenneria salicis TaxID=2590031 RepID=A0A5J5FYA0_9GAMM|nr:DNA-binding transcriptional regulator CytR [Affinibrenneria salicis]KAA8998596.1 DNA-binding transcriptional regulator CytR [Affinibrenneria salicis]